MIVTRYVYDLLIFAEMEAVIEMLKARLESKKVLKNFGRPAQFFNIELY